MVRRSLSRTCVVGCAFALAVLAGVLVLPVPEAVARPATDGSGRFGSSINWVEWGSISQPLPNGGFTGTTTQVIGDQTVTVTCVASNLSATGANAGVSYLEAYRSGTFFGDGLDDLYNIGGIGTSNQMVAGLSNRQTSSTMSVSFDVSCSAVTGTGAAVPLAGLVFGDAEASSGGEYTQATPLTAGGTWRVIDRIRAAGCGFSAIATRNAANTFRMGGDNGFCGVGGNGSQQIPGPIAVAFLDGATSMRATLASPGGKSAIAIGAVLAADHGDAPASYGDAAHLASFTYTGGEVAQDTPTRVNDPSFVLANAAPPPFRLGNNLDPETPGLFSPNADGDDTDGSGAYGPADDEDSQPSSTSVTGAVGSTYSTTVSCQPAGAAVAGWVDWNIDGDFDDTGERSATATCAGGTASLSWTIPASVVGQEAGSRTFLRIRLAQAASQIADASGVATSGEAEDYTVTLDLLPTVQVSKSLPNRARTGDQFTVAISTDGGTTVRSAATTGAATSTTTRRIIVAPGVAYQVGETISAGTSTFGDYQPVTIACSDATGATVPVTGAAPTWTIPALAGTDQTACTITNVGNQPAITIDKTVSDVIDLDGNGDDVGDRVDYSFVVRNTGNVTLTDITIAETAFSGTGTEPAATCPTADAASLAPNTSTTCSASYLLTQDDVDAGTVTNTATASGTPTGTLPRITSDPDPADVTIDRTAELTLTKSATPSAAADFVLDAEIAYSFLVTNTGTVTLSDVTIDETAFTGSGTPPEATCPDGELAPGQQLVCGATYTVTQDDVDAGGVDNTAEATATAPPGVDDPDPATDAFAIPSDPEPELTLTKTVNPTEANAAGQVVTYTFTLTNTGNVTLNDAEVVEGTFTGTGTLGDLDCPDAGDPLLPGGIQRCTATYAVTQADIDAGTVTNTATATALDPDDNDVPAGTATAELTLLEDTGIELTKTVTPTTATAEGDEVVYTFVITNTGNTTLTNVGVNETTFTGTGTLGALDCGGANASVAPDATITCTATYILTQDDVDAGVVDNTAVATGTPPGTLTPPVSDPSSAQVTIAAAPGLTIVKTVTPTTAAQAGDQVVYSFEVANTGNVRLTNPVITETAFTGTGILDPVICPSAATVLDPDEVVTCTADYTVSQDDVDAGVVENTATVAALAPDGTAVPGNADDAEITIAADPDLSLVKSVTPVDAPGDGTPVQYSFLITNTGNVTLTDVSVDDLTFTGSGPFGPITCPALEVAELAPDDAVTCTTSYILTEADADAGEVVNTAVANATAPGGLPVASNIDDATVTIGQIPSLSLVKEASPAVVGSVGQEVTYTFTVTNTGNVTLTDPQVTETAFTGTGTLTTPDCPTTTIPARGSITCTATYAVTQADLDAGGIDNTAVAAAQGPRGLTATSEPAVARVTADTESTLTLVKSVEPSADTDFVVDQPVRYSFVVTNTGTTTVTDVAIDERSFSGAGTLSAIVCENADDPLAPGEQRLCGADYTIVQADVDAGTVTNTAVVTASAPSGPIESNSSSTQLPADQEPALGLVKTATPTTVTAAGATINYSFTVTNTGNLTLTGIGIDETTFTGTGELETITCQTDTLLPGQVTTCTTSYEVTQADVDAGGIDNTAIATATDPDDTAVSSGPSSARVDITAAAGLSLVKSVTDVDPSEFAVGRDVTYTFVVTNTGNVTVDDITIDETEFTGTGDLSPVDCSTDTVAPGAQLTCTADYTITQADVDAGFVFNTAVADGTTPDDDPIVSNASRATLPYAGTYSVTMSKTADRDVVTAAGQVITYTFLITNDGTLPLDTVGIREAVFTGTGGTPTVDCPTALGPIVAGQQVACTAEYTVTDDDLESGALSNTAVAFGEFEFIDTETVTSEASTATVAIEPTDNPPAGENDEAPPAIGDDGPDLSDTGGPRLGLLGLGLLAVIAGGIMLARPRPTTGRTRP